METRIPFAKMNGIGNEIIVADMRARDDHVLPAAAVTLAADPETRFDQLMAVHGPGPVGRDAKIEIFNADGSQAGACGNGTRCVVQWLNQQSGDRAFQFEVQGQRLDARLHDDNRVSVNMGEPRFEWNRIPLSQPVADTRSIGLFLGSAEDPILNKPSVVNVGNPHVVFWTDQDVWAYDLGKFGPGLEHHPLFPDRVNISIAQMGERDTIILRTWERGAGLTRACGSAACAAAVCAVRLGKSGRSVKVVLPGGELQIDWRSDNSIIMTGEAEHEFDGLMDPLTGTWERLT